MNFFDIFSKLEKADPEIMNRLDSRRDTLHRLGNMSKKAALAAAPIALGSLFNKAFAGTNDAVSDVLNYALKLEYLEEAFYTQALAKTNLIPTGAPATAIALIKKHESAHVALLKNALGTNNTVGMPTFDFGTAFDTYGSFLTFAQAFEDAGVRAYKGKAGALLRNQVLTVALQIHSVEARHAAHIRVMRRGAAGGGVMQYGWITNGEANGAPAAIYGAGSAASTFPAEGNTTQAGINLVSGLGTAYTATEVSEAFDEALDEETIINLVKGYFK